MPLPQPQDHKYPSGKHLPCSRHGKVGERAGFGLNHCFEIIFFIFGFMAETNIFPQKMGTQLKPHFPKGNFFK